MAEQTTELAAIWEGLTSGEYEVKSCSHTEQTWSLAVTRRLRSLPPAPPKRDLDILKNVLLCGETSQVAAQVNLSKSSVAMIGEKCLRFMGIDCTPFRVPGIVVLAAHAHQRRRRVVLSTPPTKIVVARPDRALREVLTVAEYEAIKLLVEGATYTEIAEERNTSTRTVANQVRLSFRRLGVSGRVDLLCGLASAWVRGA